MERPTCATCAYWDDATGDCHRLAPLPVWVENFPNEGNTHQVIWPETEPDDWCGEHPDFPAYIQSRQKPASYKIKPPTLRPELVLDDDD